MEREKGDSFKREGLYVSVQFSHSIVSDSLRPHELQHARPPCPSPAPGVHSNSRPSSQWCHPDISSSVVPFSSCPQSLPASEFFPMIQLFTWGGQITGVSALASFLPKNNQDWSLEFYFVILNASEELKLNIYNIDFISQIFLPACLSYFFIHHPYMYIYMHTFICLV